MRSPFFPSQEVMDPEPRAKRFPFDPEIESVGVVEEKFCRNRNRRSVVRSATDSRLLGGKRLRVSFSKAGIPLSWPCNMAPEFGVARVITAVGVGMVAFENR